jgi:hypothetical protein
MQKKPDTIRNRFFQLLKDNYLFIVTCSAFVTTIFLAFFF